MAHTARALSYRSLLLLLAGHFCLLSYPANAQSAATVEDAVTQPLSDVNLKRRELPPELIAVQDNPYDTRSLPDCAAIGSQLAALNKVLGPDFDEVEIDETARKRREGVASAAGGLIGSLIPFRFLIREISGASRAERDYREALYAGIVRRGFLKGLGQARGCASPARPLLPLEGAADAAARIIRGENGE